MKILILLFLAMAVSAAGKPPANPYEGWKYAAEIIINNPDPFDRPDQVIDASVSLPLERCGNTPADIRTVTKRAFDTLDQEIPCQPYSVSTTDKFKNFRITFRVDLPANGERRVALFYDNPTAKPVNAKGRPFTFKDVPGLSAGPEGLCQIILARDLSGKVSPLVSSLVSPLPDKDTLISGPVFSAIRGNRYFASAGNDTVARLDFGVTAYASPPLAVVSSKIRFLRAAKVFEIRNAVLSFPRTEYTHYLFRPVTPTLPLTDVEEIGVVLLDSARRTSYTEGFDLMAGMLKPLLAWQGFIHMEKKRAVIALELERTAAGPLYRSAKRAVLEDIQIRLFDSPLFVKRRDTAGLAETVPKGAEYRQTVALYESEWNTGAWRSQVDRAGRTLNQPVRVAVYPIYGEEFETSPSFPLPFGNRADAYRRGVR